MVLKKSKKIKEKIFFFILLNWEKQTDMVLGKKWLVSIGNGAEIRPLEEGRKCPGAIYIAMYWLWHFCPSEYEHSKDGSGQVHMRIVGTTKD